MATQSYQFGGTLATRSGQGGPFLEDFKAFHQWSIFLPRAVSTDVEENKVYIDSRHRGNPQFFEKKRERLQAILADCNVLRATGGDITNVSDVVEAIEEVMKAQWIALGFAENRQFHKAISLGELSVHVVDALTSEQQPKGLLFWQILCRANVGDFYVRFRRHDEARTVLRQALDLVEGAGPNSAPERVLGGVCLAHLCSIELRVGELHEAIKYTDMEIEVFDTHLWSLSPSKEDKEAQATVLATAFMIRGRCDDAQSRYDSALAWFSRAIECLEKHRDLGDDIRRFLDLIKVDMDNTKMKQ